MRSLGSRFVLVYLRLFARLALFLHKPPVIIGVAGSVGKSSTRKALEALLTREKKIASVGNSETGIPLGIVGIKPEGFSLMDWLVMLIRVPFGIFYLRGVSVLIVEMGIDDPYPPKNMSYLLSVVKPSIGILVNESAAHTLQFEKVLTAHQKKELPDEDKTDLLIEKITEEDLKMITTRECRVVIYNADNRFIKEKVELEKKDSSKTYFSFGRNEKNDLHFSDYEISENGTSMRFDLGEETIAFTTHLLLPRAYQEVIAAAIGAVKNVSHENRRPEITNTELMTSLSKHFTLPKGRGSVFEGINKTLLIDSTYNASKASVITYLTLLSDLKKKTGKKAIFVFGDMRELGQEAATEHSQVAEKIVGICDEVYCVGDLTKEHVLPVVKKSAGIKTHWFPSNISAGEYLKDNLNNGSLVLLKGSQNTIFLEETVKYLLNERKNYYNLCRQEPFWLDIKKKQGRLFNQ